LELQQFKKLIISERKDFIVINKPSGLASQGGSKLSKHLDGLIQALGKEDGNHYHLVHRLDKETSGVMVIAKNRAAAQNLGAQFKSRDITKIYLAVVQGVPEQQEGKIDLALSKKWSKGFERAAVDEEGDKAVTFYKVIDFIGQSAAYVALMPVTGRNHQLRAHMAAIGCPIVGDKKYNSNSVLMDDLSDRLHLHAYKLILGDMKGSDGYKANLSDDYKKTLKMLGFNVSSKEMDKVVQLLEEQK
jgi:23S rRNA pseudouridine955/2504/2580 synthase